MLARGDFSWKEGGTLPQIALIIIRTNWKLQYKGETFGTDRHTDEHPVTFI